MTESRIPSLPFLENHNRRLIERLRAFGGADWARPSYCPGWSAAHVIGHMTLGARFYAHVVQNAPSGEMSIPFGAKDLPAFREIRTFMMKELVALSGGERVDRFEEAVSDLQDVFRAARPEDMDTPVWHPRCPTPVRYFPQQRFYELILHGWDIRNEPGSPLEAEGLEHGIDILKDRLAFFLSQEPAGGLEGFFRFETTGPDRSWGMDVRGGTAALSAADGESADASLAAPASDMILMACGRADITAKRESGAFRIDGDAEKAGALIDATFKSF